MSLAGKPAREEFNHALGHCAELLQQTPNGYSAKYTGGLAYCGLALLSDTPDADRADLLDKAKVAYTEARANCSAPGVVEDALRLLDYLKALDVNSALPALQDIVRGS